MSSRERKATDSAGRHPRMDPNLSPDDSQNPGAIDAVCMENQDLYQEPEEPVKDVLQETRERFSRIMTSSFRAVEVKVKDVLKTQWELRQKLYQEYSHQVAKLNRKLTTDANQVRKHAEKLSNMFLEQQKFIHESLTLQKNRMEELKSLCEEYLEKFQVLRESRGNSIAEELRCLIATLERKLLMLHSGQETAAAPQSLLDMLFS